VLALAWWYQSDVEDAMSGKKKKPTAFVGVSSDAYERIPPLSERKIEQAMREGRAAREAVESEAAHPVVSARVRFR
jgi:hypothetical protein